VYQQNQELARTVTELWQIYYEEKQKNDLFPFAKPVFNPSLTEFFENSVIYRVVLPSNAEKIGVCSPALRQKINFGIPMREPFTEDVINRDYDLLVLSRKQTPEHFMLAKMDNWHPGTRGTLNLILYAIGLETFEGRREPEVAVYQNAFILRTDLYKRFLREAMIPAMTVMREDPVIKARCWEDSHYYKLKSEVGYQKMIKEKTGWDYIPCHTFILERLFSCWLNGMKLKINYV
jgi:hypothetical protein